MAEAKMRVTMVINLDWEPASASSTTAGVVTKIMSQEEAIPLSVNMFFRHSILQRVWIPVMMAWTMMATVKKMFVIQI